MKLLLTSAGLANNSIIKALQELVVKPFSKLKVAFIPTASNLEEGDKQDWLIEDLIQLKNLKFNSIDIIDISALPKEIWLERLKDVDIIYVEGGNTYHLMYWFNKSGLSEILAELLKTKVYIGVSAGTVAITPSLLNDPESREAISQTNETIYDNGLSLVNFMIEPHINSGWFLDSTLESLEKRSKDYLYSIYGIDDNTAIKVDGDKIEIISEGVWKKFKK
ncbi:MAG: Type 1 glutamine amidotransferase-like domain-containing protein [Candidatus Shapirobacteria bacterium]|nr:Type 1 glutamine amidotransferase-like domain-containing protein [Candidatus Shapirobacteria bacterium]MDD4410599.1 Type 1 glutamine amidotransferase-like domain-containing protein [Candidatus Shapirobacteria bacterium]